MVLTHETVRDWEARFAPLVADQQLRIKRRGQAGRSWYVDETYIKVHGKWCYLYRAIDADGNLVDSRLSEKRDMEAAQQFFKQALSVVGHAPKQVTTDGHASYPRAVREILGSGVQHRTNKYLNNRLEQDHRGVKQRYYPMRGFGNFASAARFCRAFGQPRRSPYQYRRGVLNQQQRDWQHPILLPHDRKPSPPDFKSRRDQASALAPCLAASSVGSLSSAAAPPVILVRVLSRAVVAPVVPVKPGALRGSFRRAAP